ncbi:MAG: glycosyltransferase [Acidimicrobiia bacterium]
MIDSVSFVIPSYGTADTLPTLVDEITELAPTIAGRHTVIVVDDGCPQRSGSSVAGREGVDVYRFSGNRGQRTAVLAGLSLNESTVACVMDADLQDAPGSVVELLGALMRLDADVVCAGRRGDHQSRWRRREAAAFRRLRWVASRGRIPPDAGLFHVARAEAVRAMLAVARPDDDPLVAYARSGARLASIPILRLPRPGGSSAYSGMARMKMAMTTFGGLVMGHQDPVPLPPLTVMRPGEGA